MWGEKLVYSICLTEGQRLATRVATTGAETSLFEPILVLIVCVDFMPLHGKQEHANALMGEKLKKP